jgi:hypothetical protein
MLCGTKQTARGLPLPAAESQPPLRVVDMSVIDPDSHAELSVSAQLYGLVAAYETTAELAKHQQKGATALERGRSVTAVSELWLQHPSAPRLLRGTKTARYASILIRERRAATRRLQRSAVPSRPP